MKDKELREMLFKSIKKQGWNIKQIKQYLRDKGVKITKRISEEIEN